MKPIPPEYRLLNVVELNIPHSHRLHTATRQALATIDSIHAFSGLRPLVIQLADRPSRSWNALYHADSHPAIIELNPQDESIHFTIAHEIGHYLDDRIQHPLKNSWASHYDMDFEPLLEACLDSDGVSRMEKLLARKRSLNRPDTRFLREALLPHELFARAYAQWVAVRSDDAAMKEQLSQRLENPEIIASTKLTLQWDQARFFNIMEAMNKLLHTKGVL